MRNFKNIPPIIIHILIWVIFLVTSASQIYIRIGTVPTDFIIRTITLITAFYLNYSLLVPKLLLLKKIPLFFVVLLAFSLFFIFILDSVIPHILEPPNFDRLVAPKLMQQERLGPPNPKRFSFFRGGIRSFFPSVGLMLLIFTLSTSIRLGIEWYKTEKQRVLMKSQKVTSELSFLKTQLNPHFLFNSLNSIYSLANKQSSETTNAIVILSELMRYMIYETNKQLVPLEKEIDYIKNFISLQLLRIKDSSGVKVNIHGDLNYNIEPLLLISFIENAFKYGTDFKGNTNIRIKIEVQDEILKVYVFNSVSLQNAKNENSGIGLENVKNRLMLLYPEQHTLDIKKDKSSYEVNLSIKLKAA